MIRRPVATVRTAAIILVISGCGIGGIEFERNVKVKTSADCPEVEKVTSVTYQLRSGGTLMCNVMRVVSGQPYANASYLECQPPLYPEPPGERRGGRG